MDYEPLPGNLALFAREELGRFNCPGMAVGVIYKGRRYAQGFGITNINHPLAVTPETLFQIGSTSKTFTASAIMMLAEEGRLDIEARVRHYLPEFRLESEADAAAVTVRHLLTHRGGWVGDYFKDTGRGDDAVERIVAKMVRSPQLLPAGTAFSYSNAGFYVLGRVVEVVSGQGFESFIGDRILAPLGMTMTTYFPEQTIVHRVASGHHVGEAGLEVAPRWQTPRSIVPGGGVISTAVEQLAYLDFHLRDGTAADGRRLLRSETMAAMQSPQAEAGSMCDWIGLSWMIDQVGGAKLLKHGGSTVGQLSSFEFLPEHGFGVTVLANADTGRELRQTVADACREHFTGVRAELRPYTPGLPANSAEFEGSYQAVLAGLVVERQGDGLVVRERAPQGRAAQVPGGTGGQPLGFFAPDRAVVLEGPRRGETADFLRGPDGRVAWMRWDGRVARRL